MRLEPTGRVVRALLVAGAGAILLGIALSLTSASAVSGLPGGWGGAIGLGAAYGVDAAIELIRNEAIAGPVRLVVIVIFALAGLFFGYIALGLQATEKAWVCGIFRREPRPTGRCGAPDDGNRRGPASELPRRRRSRPAVAVPSPPDRSPPPSRAEASGRAPLPSKASRSATTTSSRRSTCSLPLRKRAGRKIDRAGLERNARLLESVLEDFHVRGDIVEVRPGPVVTMYELEPASGIKASRVIQLADDIARNMSALSARVATIPGRSVIGIELPNPKREAVALSELIGSQAYADQNMSLPLILGKNIAGDPVIADLAPDAAPPGRGHHRLRQVGRPQLHDPLAALPDDT